MSAATSAWPRSQHTYSRSACAARSILASPIMRCTAEVSPSAAAASSATVSSSSSELTERLERSTANSAADEGAISAP
eukprot:5791786-Prymnesium_polylepis.1